MQVKTFLIALAVILLHGCSTEDVVWGNKPFVEMEQETIVISEQVELCKSKPDSIFCKTAPTIGDIKPTLDYTLEILKEMNNNFTYTADDTWHYNDNVYEYLKGDCEDIASTMAMQFYNDGVDTQHLYLVYRRISDTEAHLFLAVDTVDGGLRHLDYANSGYPIEENINYYMALDNAGINKWIKGNIR